MKSPMEKYKSDPMYAHGVYMMENLIHQTQYTPSEIREMALLASINYELHRTPRNINILINKDAEESLHFL